MNPILAKLFGNMIDDARARKISEGSRVTVKPGSEYSELNPDMTGGTLRQDWSSIFAEPTNPQSKYSYLGQEQADALNQAGGLARHQAAIAQDTAGLGRIDQDTLYDQKANRIYKWLPPQAGGILPDGTMVPPSEGRWQTYAIGPDGSMARMDTPSGRQPPPPGTQTSPPGNSGQPTNFLPGVKNQPTAKPDGFSLTDEANVGPFAGAGRVLGNAVNAIKGVPSQVTGGFNILKEGLGKSFGQFPSAARDVLIQGNTGIPSNPALNPVSDIGAQIGMKAGLEGGRDIDNKLRAEFLAKILRGLFPAE